MSAILDAIAYPAGAAGSTEGSRSGALMADAGQACGEAAEPGGSYAGRVDGGAWCPGTLAVDSFFISEELPRPSSSC